MPWKLVEFIWRHKHSGNLQQAFLTTLKEVSFSDITSPSNSSTSNNSENNTSNTSDGPVPQFTQVVLIDGKYIIIIFLKKKLYTKIFNYIDNSSTTKEENIIESEPSSSSSSSSESDDDNYQDTTFLQQQKRRRNH